MKDEQQAEIEKFQASLSHKFEKEISDMEREKASL